MAKERDRSRVLVSSAADPTTRLNARKGKAETKEKKRRARRSQKGCKIESMAKEKARPERKDRKKEVSCTRLKETATNGPPVNGTAQQVGKTAAGMDRKKPATGGKAVKTGRSRAKLKDSHGKAVNNNKAVHNNSNSKALDCWKRC